MNQHIKGILLAASGAVFWGASGIAGQFLLSTKNFSPEQLTDIRLLAAGILLLLTDVLLFRQDIWGIWRNNRDVRSLIIFGAVGLLSTQYTYFSAIKVSNAPTATILQYLLPIIMVGWTCLTKKRPPTVKELFCTLFAFLGTFLIATKGNIHSLALSPEALFFGITSAFAAAVYTLQPKRLLSIYPATVVIGWGMLIGGLVFLPFASPWHFIGTFDSEALLAFLFVVIVGTILSFSLYLSSMKYIEPVEMSIIASLEPLSSILFAFVLLGLTFALPELAGIALILVSVFVVSI